MAFYGWNEEEYGPETTGWGGEEKSLNCEYKCENFPDYEDISEELKIKAVNEWLENWKNVKEELNEIIIEKTSKMQQLIKEIEILEKEINNLKKEKEIWEILEKEIGISISNYATKNHFIKEIYNFYKRNGYITKKQKEVAKKIIKKYDI